MPNTYLGLRQIVLRPVICRGQPQSEPGTACGTPSVTTTGLPLGALYTRRAAIRRILGGAAKDLLIWLTAIVTGHLTQDLYSAQPTGNAVEVPCRHVLASIVRHAMVLMGSGVTVGGGLVLLFVALGGGPTGRPAEDVVSFAAWIAVTSAVMLGAGLLACVEPAWRAVRINPSDALRDA